MSSINLYSLFSPSRIPVHSVRVTIALFLFIVVAEAQVTIPGRDHDLKREPQSVRAAMMRKWDLRRKRALGEPDTTAKLIRIVYLVPSDRVVTAHYRDALRESILHLQSFYQSELGYGTRFSLADPIVETYSTNHPAAYYSTSPSASGGPLDLWFWENVLNDGFALTGGGFNDPNNRWIFYIDADIACGQKIGGNSGGAVVMTANDLRGLAGETNLPPCVNEPPDNGGRFRWIGGSGHELAHSFGVPHPPGCGSPGPFSGCTGGLLSENSLMWFGYSLYPNTHFLADDKQTLLLSGFFSNGNLASVSGRVTREDGRGVAGARLLLWNNGGSEYAITNQLGYYRLLKVRAGASYWLFADHKQHIFNPRALVLDGDLAGIDFSAQ